MKTLHLPFSSLKRLFLFSILLMPFSLLAVGNWPKEITTAKSDIIIYQPQPDSMRGDHLYSRAAISFTTTKIITSVYGAIWTDSRFSTDREAGTITIYDVKILNVRFPGIDTADPAKVQKFKDLLAEQSTAWKLVYSLDELKSSLTATQATYGATPKFNNDPPEIIYAKRNSVLLLFDGDPVFKEIENTGLKRAVNTPFFVLQDLKNKTYYLYGTDFWYKSMNPITGAWSNIPKPPSNVVKVFDDLNKQIDYSGNSAQTQTTSQPLNSGVSIPDIIVRTKPSELIQSSGEPAYAPIQGTQLLYMTNTDDNIFMTIDNNQYFILVSGRWYHSSALSGPWSFIDSDKLPPDFARIPEGSEKDVVLASIAGTNAAKDAVMDAQIPQTAAVDRKTATCVVEYDGYPKF